ncbi:DUF3800 domain-containing protein [Lentzea tibetensis]|uniref:DUF3800 domain-containing protein n=1 Tax=Lentzea tibetensis TaxID=2591470 RepID=UPI001646A9AA|nr:DUF3800 domain-containing protein [Lentzea tibetensis]
MGSFPPAHEQPHALHPDHPTSVAFFDEAGAISSDRFFAVGLLRVANHADLLKEVKKLRKAHGYHDEFKWAGLTTRNRQAMADLIDLLLDSDAIYSCFVADRSVADPVERFGDSFQAYEKLATQLLHGSVRPHELVSVLADHYSAPNNRSFENTVRRDCNARLRRLAVVSVVQVDSGATEGLQLVDVLTGAVAFGFKADNGLASHDSLKGRTAARLRARLGVENFASGHVSTGFSVRVYEHDRWIARRAERALRVLSRGVPVA